MKTRRPTIAEHHAKVREEVEAERVRIRARLETRVRKLLRLGTKRKLTKKALELLAAVDPPPTIETLNGWFKQIYGGMELRAAGPLARGR